MTDFGPPPPLRRLGAEGISLAVGARPAQRLALRILQVGAVGTALAASTYRTFELDRFFVPKELALHLTALLVGLLCLASARRAVLSRVDVLLAGFLGLGVLSVAFATNPWLGQRSLAISLSGIVLFWSARSLARVGLGRPVLASVALAVIVGVATALAQAYGIWLDVFSVNRAPGGTLGNRNSIAHLAAFGLPVVLLVALRAAKAKGWLLGAVGAGLSVGTLVLTRSRAAYLAVAALVAVLLVGWVLVPPLRRHGKSWRRFLGILVVSAAGVAGAILLPNALRWKSDNPYRETAQGVVNYREGSGRGRLIQYANTSRMAARDPLFGAGPGNWPVVYPRFAKADDPSMDQEEPGTTSNPWPSSDWVALLAERGLPAFLLLMGTFLALAITAWRRMRTATDADEGLAGLVALSTLAAVGVVGAFDAVLLLALPSFLVWTTLGALTGDEAGWRTVEVGWGRKALGLLLLLGCVGGSAARSGGSLAAMGLLEDGQRTGWERAAKLDPGNYRVRLALARSYRGRATCEKRREHAEAASALFPEAAAPKALRGSCGGGRRRR